MSVRGSDCLPEEPERKAGAGHFRGGRAMCPGGRSLCPALVRAARPLRKLCGCHAYRRRGPARSQTGLPLLWQILNRLPGSSPQLLGGTRRKTVCRKLLKCVARLQSVLRDGDSNLVVAMRNLFWGTWQRRLATFDGRLRSRRLRRPRCDLLSSVLPCRRRGRSYLWVLPEALRDVPHCRAVLLDSPECDFMVTLKLLSSVLQRSAVLPHGCQHDAPVPLQLPGSVG
mmetsp:Transcript_1417/g.4616  ORF Transcript_1417/g.4616 Transcript_1417/m.4616 type:complete len:227 (-) Transcript_1417:7-687(-)